MVSDYRSNASDETNEDGSIDAKPPTPPPNLGRKKSMAPTAPAPPVVKTRKLTAKESDEEAKVCALMEDKIAILKKELIDKKVIFEKLAAELFRMLGLFERLKKMGESGRSQEIVEAETQVTLKLKSLTLFLCTLDASIYFNTFVIFVHLGHFDYLYVKIHQSPRCIKMR